MANTTCQEIVNRAMRLIGVTGAGQAAVGHDATDAETHLRELVNELPGLFRGPWTDVIRTDSTAYTAKDQDRINCGTYSPVITLPTTRKDPDTGDTVAMPDLSRVQVIGTTGGGVEHAKFGLWVFSASRASWSRADSLSLTSDSPFGKEDDAGLSALLAVALAPEFTDAGEVPSVVVERAARQMRSFRARFRRTTHAPLDLAYLAMSDTGNRSIYDPDTL